MPESLPQGPAAGTPRDGTSACCRQHARCIASALLARAGEQFRHVKLVFQRHAAGIAPSRYKARIEIPGRRASCQASARMLCSVEISAVKINTIAAAERYRLSARKLSGGCATTGSGAPT